MMTQPGADAASVIKTISDERSGLRAEIILMETSMHRAIFAFVAVAAVAAGLYFNERVFLGDETARAVILFALTQVEFILTLFVLTLIANQNVHSGYLRVLEEKINELSGVPVSAWESSIVPTFLFSLRGVFFWSYVAFWMVLFVVYVIFVVAAMRYEYVKGSIFVGVLIVELLLLAVLAIFIHREPSRVARFTRAALKRETLGPVLIGTGSAAHPVAQREGDG